MSPTPLIRTLDQEVLALLRGASLECLVCGEFVQHRLGVIACPDCGSPILVEKVTKRAGRTQRCYKKECGYSVQVEDSADAEKSAPQSSASSA